MKIIIPMSGVGRRFAEAGYDQIKPLIHVHGKPIIEWVVQLFPDALDILFICRDDHLNDTPLKDVLQSIAPHAAIQAIKGHKKGPVFAVSEVFDQIDKEEPILVSYCDYFMNWSFQAFQEHIKRHDPDGSVICYRGFHPHLLVPKNVYAGCLEKEGQLTAIKEKHSFTTDKTQSHHSVGLYYFKTGSLLKKSFSWLLENKYSLNNEYYVSMAYDYLLAHQYSVTVYDQVPHFCQWGTPEDLDDYRYWNGA